MSKTIVYFYVALHKMSRFIRGLNLGVIRKTLLSFLVPLHRNKGLEVSVVAITQIAKLTWRIHIPCVLKIRGRKSVKKIVVNKKHVSFRTRVFFLHF